MAPREGRACPRDLRTALSFLVVAQALYLGSCVQEGAVDRARAEIERSGIDATLESFRECARRGDIETTRLFLAVGFEPESALVAAAMGGHADILGVLLEAEADVGSSQAVSALAWAMFRGHSESAEMLSAAGADLNATSQRGETRLVRHVQRRESKDIRRYLDLGADPDIASNTGETALMFAVQSGDEEIANLLIAVGADAGARDKDGWTALMRAAHQGYAVLTRDLLGAGAEVDTVSDLGWTALMLASYEGYAETVAVLLEAGADPEISSSGGKTALIRAVQAGHLETVEVLLRAEASVRTAVDGLDARDWAALAGRPRVIAVLETAGDRAAAQPAGAGRDPWFSEPPSTARGER